TTTVNATGTGQFNVGNVSALSNGPVTVTSGIFANSTGITNFALPNPINFNNSVVTFATNSFFFAGAITLTGANTFTSNTPVFFAGVVSGTGSLNVIAGNALVLLNPNNTYSGGTNVSGSGSNGQLQVTTSDV